MAAATSARSSSSSPALHGRSPTSESCASRKSLSQSAMESQSRFRWRAVSSPTEQVTRQPLIAFEPVPELSSLQARYCTVSVIMSL